MLFVVRLRRSFVCIVALVAVVLFVDVVVDLDGCLFVCLFCLQLLLFDRVRACEVIKLDVFSRRKMDVCLVVLVVRSFVRWL